MSIQYNDEMQNKKKGKYNVGEENRKRRNEKKEIMLKLVALSEPNGLSTPELSKRIHRHPDTVLRLGNELESEGKVFKTGKFGKYRITSKAIGSPEIKGFLFGSKVMKQFYLFERPELQIKLEGQNEKSDIEKKEIESTLKQSISVNNKFCNSDYCKSIVLRQPYDRIIPDKGLKDELSLFEFAIRIGSIITYEMIQALKYGSSPILENQVNKDIMAWKWVDSVIKPDLILAAFAKLDPVGRILKRNKNVDQPRGPFYEVDEKGDLKQLIRSFENVFPDVYERLENIMEGIPGEVELIRNHSRINHSRIRQLEREDPDHTKCNGD